MLSPLRLRLSTLLIASLAAMQLAGCAGVPVQEMSNARQAVHAAQKAGGAKYAPETMAEAEKLLASAKANLKKGEYRPARDEAELAREKAMEARRQAEAARAAEKAEKAEKTSKPDHAGP
jgi:acyl-CoA synthetase (AMP-forming)/AMP-acid ligase II